MHLFNRDVYHLAVCALKLRRDYCSYISSVHGKSYQSRGNTGS